MWNQMLGCGEILVFPAFVRGRAAEYMPEVPAELALNIAEAVYFSGWKTFGTPKLGPVGRGCARCVGILVEQ